MKAHMIKLPGLGRQARLNVAQAFPVRQLGKCHGAVLFGARQVEPRSRHDNAQRAARMCSRAGNPSVAKKPSFRRTLVSPSPEKGPGSRLLLQVDTTQNRRKAIISQILRGSSFGKLRTVVSLAISMRTQNPKDNNESRTQAPIRGARRLHAWGVEFVFCSRIVRLGLPPESWSTRRL